MVVRGDIVGDGFGDNRAPCRKGDLMSGSEQGCVSALGCRWCSWRSRSWRWRRRSAAMAASVYWVDVCGGSTGNQVQGLGYWSSDGNIISSNGCRSPGGGISIEVAGAGGNEGAGGQGTGRSALRRARRSPGWRCRTRSSRRTTAGSPGWQGSTGGGLSVSDDPWPWQDCNLSGSGYCSNGSGTAIAATAELAERGRDRRLLRQVVLPPVRRWSGARQRLVGAR